MFILNYKDNIFFIEFTNYLFYFILCLYNKQYNSIHIFLFKNILSMFKI